MFDIHRFVFAGVGKLAEHLLMSEAKNIRTANAAGMRKMLRNITALRQGIKAIEVIQPGDAEFETAKAYYSLFSLGPEVCIHAFHPNLSLKN